MNTASQTATDTASNDAAEASMLALAAAADAGQPIDSTPAATADTASQPAPDVQGQPGQTPAAKGDSTTEKTATKPEDPANAKPETPYTKARKDGERLQKTWKSLEAEKVAFREERARIAQEDAAIRRELAELKAARQQPATTDDPADPQGHKASTYDDLAKGYEEEGNARLAKLARDHAAHLRSSAAKAPTKAAPAAAAPTDSASPEFQARWQQTAEEIVKAEPELADANHPVFKAVDELVNRSAFAPFFRARPDGLRAAVEVAKLQQQAARVGSLEKDLTTAKAEVARLSKLTQPRGSHPASPAPGAKRPEDLTDDDVRQMAYAADHGT